MKAGCSKDSSTLVGRMKVNAKLVTRRNAQTSTGSTIAQNGTRLDGRFQEPTESVNKKRKPQRKSGSGKGVSSRILSVTKWESEKHKSSGMPAKGFKGHVATDGSLLGNAGKWRACDWAVVQLDYDEEMGPLHGMYGSMDGLPLPAHKSDWTHQGACRQRRNS